jgi:hypothetical protein
MSHDDESMNAQGSMSTKSILSIRVVVESVAVAAILWLAATVNQASLSIARLQVQLSQVQATLADVPSLTREMAQMQTIQAEHERRLSSVEAIQAARR